MKKYGLWLLLLAGLAAAGAESETNWNLAATRPGTLPEGFQAYITGTPEGKQAGSVGVAEVDGQKGVRISDRSPQAEFGLVTVLPCPPGTYYRITVKYRSVNRTPIQGVELTGHFNPAAKMRAGTVLLNESGCAVLNTVAAPAGTRELRVYVYSFRAPQNDLLIESFQVERATKPFDAAAVAPLAGRTFFLAPDGRDAAAGDAQSPWKTIERANRTLQPGDTVVFRPGRYEGTIAPARSGAPDAPIVYRAEKPGSVILTGSQANGAAAKIANRSHIELDGFRFEVLPGTRWLLVNNAQHCTFRNLDMEGATVANPIGCSDSSYLKFHNIRAVRCRNIGRNGVLDGDMWNNYNIRGCVFEKMVIGQVGHRPFGLWFDCDEIVVRDSIFDCRWGRNFEFFSPRKVLMERCVVTNAFEGSGSFDGLAKLYLNDSIFRNNLIIRNGYMPIGIGGYQYADMPNFTSTNSRYYHNTFHRNQDAGISFGGDNRDIAKTCLRSNIFKNNIFAGNDFDNGTALRGNSFMTPDSRIVNNLLFGNRPGDATVSFYSPEWKGNCSTREAETRCAPFFAANLDCDPQFADPDRGDYTLRRGSPAIDAGAPLSVTREAGKNTVYLPVEDARYFFDGYRIPGEKGDLVMVGGAKTEARIVHIAERQNVLILDRRISFAKGDAVNLAYAGKAPDLGAYENDLAPSGGPVFEDRAIRQKPNADGALLVSSFEPEDRENWFYLWNFTRQPSSWAALDDRTAANGKYSWRVHHVPYEELRQLTSISPRHAQSDSTLSTHLSPAWWEIDRYPILEFAYKIPAGVPVGVTLYCDSRSATPGPGSIFIAGSPALQLPAGYVDLRQLELIADGQWHRASIDLTKLRQAMPKVRYIYKLRFWAGGPHGKPGSEYHLDDVAIRQKPADPR